MSKTYANEHPKYKKKNNDPPVKSKMTEINYENHNQLLEQNKN